LLPGSEEKHADHLHINAGLKGIGTLLLDKVSVLL